MSETTAAAIWPEELDALRAAPEHHRLLFENDAVRVLDTRIEPGETVKLHTHRWPGVYYFVSAGDFVRRNAAGEVEVDSRTLPQRVRAGEAVWLPPLGPHTLENVGTTVIHAIGVEVKTQGT